jgi:serine/threonine protein kinase
MALKVISERYLGDESARLLFLREARAAARLRHSNVASVLHLGESAGNYFYAMEFVEGETLENLIPIIAPGRWAARIPGIGPLRRSSTPARKKAIVDKSHVEPERFQGPAFVFPIFLIGLRF